MKTNTKIGIFLLLLLFLVPVFQLNILLDRQLGSRFLLLSIVLLFGFVILKPNIKINYLQALLFAFYLWNVLSIFWATNFAEALFQSQVVFLGVVLFSFLSAVLDQESTFTYIWKIVALSNITLLIICLYQIKSLPSVNLNDVYAIIGLNGHKNLLASFLFLQLPFLILGLVSESKKVWKGIYVSCIVLTLAVLLILQTRAVYVGLSITALVAVLLFLFFHKQVFNRKTLIGIFLVLTMSVSIWCLVSYVKNGNSIDQAKAQQEKQNRRESNSERLALWTNSIEMIKENWLLGVGAGNWQIEYPRYTKIRIKSVDTDNLTFQRPHNDFIWTFSETGLIGFLLLMSVNLIIAYGCIKTMDHSNTRVNDKLEIMVLLGFLVGYWAISFFDFPKERMEHVVYSSLILVLLGLKTKSTAFWHTEIKVMKPLYLLPISVLLFNIVVAYYRINGENRIRYAYLARGYSDWSRLIEECDRAKSVFYTVDPTSIPIDWYRGLATFSLENNDAALQDFTNAAKYNPNNFNILNNLGSAYETNGNHDKAEKYYLQALKINPTFDEARLNLFVIYYNQKKYTEGLSLLQKCSPSERKTQYLQLIKTN